ncbi:hypothetical protein T07_4778 [Trichinella nelsoni]|uniref:Uncharacterized protein n=1 Tax=Trichinella nelsoni TaxID=6336 RepID=A0A0V0RU28_9BILA|nr:hypothetical protein T07_4778 [Trichinella nelsoni]
MTALSKADSELSTCFLSVLDLLNVALLTAKNAFSKYEQYSNSYVILNNISFQHALPYKYATSLQGHSMLSVDEDLELM